MNFTINLYLIFLISVLRLMGWLVRETFGKYKRVVGEIEGTRSERPKLKSIYARKHGSHVHARTHGDGGRGSHGEQRTGEAVHALAVSMHA
jgi:Na+-transporting methylmalonyl-CoA/oxaloacetate decarboxylase gamma subunit